MPDLTSMTSKGTVNIVYRLIFRHFAANLGTSKAQALKCIQIRASSARLQATTQHIKMRANLVDKEVVIPFAKAKRGQRSPRLPKQSIHACHTLVTSKGMVRIDVHIETFNLRTLCCSIEAMHPHTPEINTSKLGQGAKATFHTIVLWLPHLLIIDPNEAN